MALEYVSLTLDLQDGQGNVPAQGAAVCMLNAELIDTVDHADIAMTPIPVTWEEGGSAPVVSLLSNASPNLLPAGSVWTLTFSDFEGTQPATRSFSLDYNNGASQYLSGQTLVASVPQMAGYLQGAYPGSTDEFLNGAGEWSVPPSESSGGAVTAVNGKTGAVELTAADVSADPAGSVSQLVANPTFTAPVTSSAAVTGLRVVSSGVAGATAASRYVGATVSGPPTTGPFVVGDYVVDQAGAMWVYATGGNWVSVGVGGSGGPVTAVNGKTGAVSLAAADVGAWPATALAGPSVAHTTVWGLPNGSLLVLPLATYGLTGDDGVWINNAINQLPVYLSYPSGKIHFVNGTYNLATGLTSCPYVRFIGAGQGTIFKYTGNGKSVYPQNTRPSDTETDYRLSGGFEDIVLDITGAGANAYGIYLDSTQAYWLKCAVIGKPSSTTQAGVWVANDSHSLNSLYGYCHIQDCGQGLSFSTSGTGSAAQERIDVKWKIQVQNGQTAVSVLNGMQVQSSDIRLHINNDQYANTAFNFGAASGGGPSNFYDCHFVTRVEPLGTGASGWSNPTVVAAKFANANCGWKDCTGIMFVSPSMPPSGTGGATLGKMVWGGVLANDTGLLSVQTKPNGWL